MAFSQQSDSQLVQIKFLQKLNLCYFAAKL